MSEPSSTPASSAVAGRNMEAILDGAEHLLASGRTLSISAVADEARVSRPTVYAHFADRRLLVTALLERSIRHALTAIELAQPELGPASDALRRVATTGWEHLARHLEIARAAAGELSSDAVHAYHEPVLEVIETLVERGQRERAFRRDLPVKWLATSCLALIHSAAHAVSAGHMKPNQAKRVLPTTLVDLCVGPNGGADYRHR